MVRRQARWQLRSSAWLRRPKVRRASAALLLLAFAVGSIFGRDAVLASRVREIRAASECVGLATTLISIEGRHRRSELKVRPSGMSKRTAWSPTDPPDDDDETDEDSDTLAAHLRALPIEATFAVGSACVIDAAGPSLKPRLIPPTTILDQPRVRGPPSLRVASS